MVPWRGDWALVTGASSGIGQEFAIQLAAAGLNLALIARRGARLDALALKLRSDSGVETMVAVADLGEPGVAASVLSRLEAVGVRVRLLVNNAGAGRWGRFETVAIGDYDDMLRVNNTAMVALCRAFFPHLRSFPSSAVINVSSQAAFQPVPFMAVYGASKAFVHHFSLALYEEWRRYGIHVQTLVPGPTRSEFDQKAGAYASAVRERHAPSEAVSAALKRLERDGPMVSSARGTFKQRVFAGCFPPRFVVREVGKMFRPPDED